MLTERYFCTVRFFLNWSSKKLSFIYSYISLVDFVFDATVNQDLSVLYDHTALKFILDSSKDDLEVQTLLSKK